MLEFFAVVNGRSPLRINTLVLSGTLQDTLTHAFHKQASDICGKTRQVFSSSYRAESNEALVIENYKMPELYQNILQNSDSFERFAFTVKTAAKKDRDRRVSIKAILGVEQTRLGFNYYFQSLAASRVLFQKTFMAFANETFTSVNDNGLILDTKLAAAHKNGDLIFTSYRTINPFLDITDYFHEATAEEIIEILGNDLFDCDEVLRERIANNSDEWMRKRFSGLKTLLPEIRKNKPSYIVERAREYGIDTTVIRRRNQKKEITDFISFPKEAESIKKFLAFLNEEIYTGELTGKQYKSSSQAPLSNATSTEEKTDVNVT